MAGLKTFWILIYSLLLLAACVPQTKQTECQGNEAFNAALRTCVPVVGGPSSFINVGTYSPAFTQTRHKGDSTTLQFSISVSNPYNQTYTVAWERVFNGAPISMCSNALTCSFSASYLGTTLGEVGTHILTAKILDGNGSVVDTHSFELKINELPKPIINTATILPSAYAFTTTPGSASSEFKFTIKNNQATLILSDYYRTEWTIEKNGIILYTESDTFSNLNPAGTNLAYLGTSPTPYFNPSTLGVGNYVVRAVVKNDVPGEVVDEHQWNVTVSHPALKKIDSRDIYFGSNNPNGVSAVSIAYNGIAYNSGTSYNFIPQSIGATTFTLQGNYCVHVENGEGTYVGDGLGVKVNFLIDGGSQIYSGTTTALNQKICLSDAAATTLNTMLFTNTTTTNSQNHTLVARVYDEATNQEYTVNDMFSGLGTYPVTWNFLVKPANAAPTISFAPTSTLTNLTNCNDVGNARSCTIAQDKEFTVGINAVDEFYSTSSLDDTNHQNKFTYSMTLMRNGSPLSTCTKTTGNTTDTSTPTWNAGTSTWSNVDFVGPEYHCGFVVPSYDANGPVNPLTNVYSVVITFSDVGSPIPGTTPATSNTLVYNLNVTEANTAPSIVAQQGAGGGFGTNSSITELNSSPTVINPNTPGQTLTEGQTMVFNVIVNDVERDNHQIQIYKCTDFTSTCSTTTLLDSEIVTSTNSNNPKQQSIGYTIPEDFLTSSATLVDGTSNSPNTFFKVVVTDCPSILNGTNATNCNTSPTASGIMTPRLTSNAIFSAKIINKNPAPQFGGTPDPATSVTNLTTMVGFPLTIYPGTVTDTSTVSTENTISYQWYIDTDATNEDNYAPITGATEQILRWTPSNGLTSTSVGLALCVSDSTTVNPFPTNAQLATALSTITTTTTGANCKGRWKVTVRKNAVPLAYSGGTVDAASPVAVWQDTTVIDDKKVIYSAYTDLNEQIYIEKTVFDANGVIYNDATTGFKTVTFPAIASLSIVDNSVKDISLAGTPTHLYIAYQAADTSTPGAPRIRIRRIDKRYGTVGSTDYGSKITTGVGAYPHAGKFGFTYAPLAPGITSSATPTPVSVTQDSILNFFNVAFNGDFNSGDILTTNGVLNTAAPALASTTTLCSGGGGTCTVGDNAIRYRDFINNSTNRDLQGLTASFSTASTTIIYGHINGNESLDVGTFVTGNLGKIMIFDIGGGSYEWFLPFVDKTTGTTLDYIRVLKGSANESAILSTITPDSSDVYSSIGPVNYFTNDYNTSNNIIIGSVNTLNVSSLNVFDLNANPIPTPSSTLFDGYAIDPTTLRFSGPVIGNPKYYMLAKVLTAAPSTYEWKIGNCDVSLNCSYNNLTTSPGAALNAATAALLTVSSLKDLSIESYPNSIEARILINSGTGTDTNLYTLRYRSDEDVSCGLCVPLNVSGSGTTTIEKLSPNKSVATTKIDTNMTIGSQGSAYSPSQNERDVMFAVYPVLTGSAPNIYTPHMSIINTDVETINSTSTSLTGLLGHRPAFFGDN